MNEKERTEIARVRLDLYALKDARAYLNQAMARLERFEEEREIDRGRVG